MQRHFLLLLNELKFPQFLFRLFLWDVVYHETGCRHNNIVKPKDEEIPVAANEAGSIFELGYVGGMAPSQFAFLPPHIQLLSVRSYNCPVFCSFCGLVSVLDKQL